MLLTEYYSNHNDSDDTHHDHHLKGGNSDIYYNRFSDTVSVCWFDAFKPKGIVQLL